MRIKPDKYRGIIPVFYACYDRAGEVSGNGMRALTRYFVDQGVKGVYVGGSSGECTYQSVGDRKKTPETVMDGAAGYLTVIVHVACSDIKDNRTPAVYAQSLGMNGIVAIPPIYFKLPEYSAAGYWNDISEAAPDMGLIIYNTSQLADTAPTISLLRTMLLNGHVAGMRSSPMPVQDIQMFKAEAMKTREDLIVFNRPDEQLVSGLTTGTDEGIGGTYGTIPELFSKIYDLVSENRVAEVRAIQYGAGETTCKLCSGTCNMYAMTKEVLRASRGTDIGGVRKSLTDLCDGDRAIAGEAVATIEVAKEKYR